jgi:hypothetical protein
MKVGLLNKVQDKLVAELQQRFPAEMSEFACLDPRHFNALDSEQRLRRHASRCALDEDTVASQ